MGFATPSLKGRALRLLSGREHSRLELERKLAPFEEEPGSLAAALDELQAKGFISEQRVKQMRFLASRGFGGDTIRRVVAGADDA